MKTAPAPGTAKSEFLDSIQKGLLLGVAVLALVLPPTGMNMRKPVSNPASRAMTADAPHKRADFGSVVPTEDVRQLANWAMYVGDNQNKSFVILDKKDARVYVFDRGGRLKAESPALLGYAVGDDNAPGIGSKPIADVLPEERTTPAGRFVAEIGMNARNEDVVWVDYDAAVSMHRVLTTNPQERRLERLATATSEDNRVSYGCINLPVAFFEQVLAPTVRQEGAIIYVLPETRSPQQVFASFDVERQPKVAKR
ncbi:hypothetical protein [Ramlibacter sp. WS9]|uniref:hypothetical protein n=1 Tax=Ramlibacter sp. WS9 TaxID=1882741 RepID=UPI001141B8EF|nr:hypothetical protein [Ramlibacter sp. WS9]ROZ69715.1 hypothetical protein EEB15_22740 [Ramlibacter sp. WS9]